MQRILTITLNPTIDCTTGVPELIPRRKLRCEAATFHPGGGGVNVSRVIKELGGETTAMVAVAGHSGQFFRGLILDAGIDAVFLEARGMTRQSFAVHEGVSGHQFRLLFPGPKQDAAFGDRALAMLGDLLAADAYPYVVASGSLLPGLSEDFYRGVADLARRHGSRLILDTSGPALEAALGHGAYLLKPDFLEAQALAAALGLRDDDPEQLARLILDKGGAEVVIITLGADGALLATKDEFVRIRSPKVEMVSRVGAGDSFIGALSFALAADWPLEKACAYGVAAAAAAVTTEASELAYKADIDRLYAGIELVSRAPQNHSAAE